jgi:hypothetical protein
MDTSVTGLTGRNDMSKKIYGEYANISGIDQMQKTYEDNRWTKETAMESPLSIESVLATQSLVMQILAQQERSVMSGNKRHVFAAVNNLSSNNDEFYDGSLEEYVACRVAKVQHDQWKMRIRFRQNEVLEDRKTESYVDDFSFDWLRNGNLQAWYGNYLWKKTPEGTFEAWQDVHPIEENELEIMHNRLREHVDLSKSAIALHRSIGDRREAWKQV